MRRILAVIMILWTFESMAYSKCDKACTVCHDEKPKESCKNE